MRNLFLMSVFSLFMIAAVSGQSLSQLTLVTPAFADSESDKAAAELAKKEADSIQKDAEKAKIDAADAQAKADEAASQAAELGTQEAKDAAEKAKKKADIAKEYAKQEADKAEKAAKTAKDAMDVAMTLHCATGIASCYSASGTPGISGIDPNQLPPTGGLGGGALVSVVKPGHFRSF